LKLSEIRLLSASIVWLACSSALSQGNSEALGAPDLAVNPCKHDVLQYQEGIAFVKKTLGEKAASDLAAKFMSKQQWDALLLNEGYCGIARALRTRKP